MKVLFLNLTKINPKNGTINLIFSITYTIKDTCTRPKFSFTNNKHDRLWFKKGSDSLWV